MVFLRAAHGLQNDMLVALVFPLPCLLFGESLAQVALVVISP